MTTKDQRLAPQTTKAVTTLEHAFDASQETSLEEPWQRTFTGTTVRDKASHEDIRPLKHMGIKRRKQKIDVVTTEEKDTVQQVTKRKGVPSSSPLRSKIL